MQDNEPINLTYGQMSDMVNRIEQIPALSGAGAPTTSTPAFHLGQTYIDTTTGDMYYCSEAIDESGSLPEYIWELVTEETPEYVAGDNVTITDESGSMVISATDTTYSNFTGTDGTAAGTAGLVPAPATTDAGKFLKADGTWDTAGGGGPTVVQTTGTSTTSVMSQNAVTSMVFADPSVRNKVQIGLNATSSQNSTVAVGNYAAATGYYGVAVGNGAKASGYASIALGWRNGQAGASGGSSIAIGSNTDATADSTVAIGSGAQATVKGQFDISTSKITSQGYNNSNYRLLTGLYDPQSAHDAATKGYVDPTTDSSAPTTATVGRLGQIQIDTTTATAYMCVEADDVTPSYTWKQITA